MRQKLFDHGWIMTDSSRMKNEENNRVYIT